MKADAEPLGLLLISAQDALSRRVAALLPESIGPARLAKTAREALPILERGDAELVILAEPVPGDEDQALLPTLLREEKLCLLVITEQLPRPALTERGVLTLSPAAPDDLLAQSAALLAATRRKLRRLETKAEKLQARVEDLKVINRAKFLLVQQLRMTEAEAHRYIEKQAMDTCRKRRTIAENIIRTYEA